MHVRLLLHYLLPALRVGPQSLRGDGAGGENELGTHSHRRAHGRRASDRRAHDGRDAALGAMSAPRARADAGEWRADASETREKELKISKSFWGGNPRHTTSGHITPCMVYDGVYIS